jgi:hypothetical protein
MKEWLLEPHYHYLDLPHPGLQYTEREGNDKRRK